MNHCSDTDLDTVSVPDDFQTIFLKAQKYVKNYFSAIRKEPGKGLLTVSDERYILVRAAAMSKDFFDIMTQMYMDRGEREARALSFNFLFDIAHAIGKADAKSFFKKMKVDDPIERLSAGPILFAYTGWASVKIHPLSTPTPDENFYLIYDHPYSFEAQAWLDAEEHTDFPVCVMNAGYSSGWCEESFSISLVTAEVECRAKGDRHCRFIMAPPEKTKTHIKKYSDKAYIKHEQYNKIDIPEFFKRKRIEDDLRHQQAELEALVQKRTDKLRKTNQELKEANIALRVMLKQMETFNAGLAFARSEGYISAPECNHAVAMTIREALKAKEEGKEKTILFNWSGHGLVDLGAYESFFRGKLSDHDLPQEQIDAALKDLESLPKPKQAQ